MALKKVIAGALLVLSIAACGGSSDSRDRNVGVSLAGTTCTKLGEVSKKKGSSYVCAAVSLKGAGAAAKKNGILYGVAAVKNWRCEKLGTTRYQNGVFSVCSGGKDKKSRKWALTVALPANITSLVSLSETTQAGALEAIGVTPPPELVPAPGPNVPVAGGQSASGDGTGAIVGTTTTSSLPLAFVVKQAPSAESTPTTVAAPTTVVAPTATVGPATVTTIGPVTTVAAPATTVAPVTTASGATTVAPTTVESTTVTTTAPATTASGATTVAPVTTATTPATTPPTTTPAPATTVVPVTTATTPPTTVAPTTTAPKNLTCAEGGACKAGDVGPAGGVVVLNNFNLSAPAVLIEVAPVTWYGSYSAANSYAEGLVYGRKSDWRLPTVLDLLSMRRDRALFRCPGVKRCWRGFANAVYLAANENQGIKGVDFGGISPMAQSVTGGAYVRPVRTIVPIVGEIQVLPVLEPS